MFFTTHISKLSKPIVSSVLVGMVLVGCEDSEREGLTNETSININVTEPVDRDLEEIKEDGVLRMITSYSSGSYFLYGGVERGFEYELVKEFAKSQNLGLEVIILREGDNPYDLLNSGVGDVIAASYTKTPERDKYVDFTRPYNLVDQLIIYNQEENDIARSIDEIQDLTISVRRNSSYYNQLRQLQEQGVSVSINLVPSDMDTEALLFAVSQGEYEATVADNNLYAASRRYMKNLATGPTIAKNDTISWVIRENADKLEEKMNQFLYKHFRITDSDQPPKRSALLNVLRRRYFSDQNTITKFYQPPTGDKYSGLLSPYDKLIKPLADSAGIDWRMIAAIIAQESQFDPNTKSWAGAVGLMQIIPRYSEVENPQDLYDPETNVKEGIRILKEHLDHYSYMDSVNCWKFSLATYNSGMGHIADARRLTIDQNKNPNEWEPVADALLKLMRRQYYKDARYGFARGIETVRYVRQISNRYETYQAIMELAQNQQNRIRPASIGTSPLN